MLLYAFNTIYLNSSLFQNAHMHMQCTLHTLILEYTGKYHIELRSCCPNLMEIMNENSILSVLFTWFKWRSNDKIICIVLWKHCTLVSTYAINSTTLYFHFEHCKQRAIWLTLPQFLSIFPFKWKAHSILWSWSHNKSWWVDGPFFMRNYSNLILSITTRRLCILTQCILFGVSVG